VLLLLLVVSGFCVWTARSLTSDIDRMISSNFESIRAMRSLRLAVVRIDAQYRSATTPAEISKVRGLFDVERLQIQRSISLAEANADSDREREALARVAALAKDYLGLYEEYFGLGRSDSDRFKALARSLGQFSSDITEAVGVVQDINEATVLERRAAAASKGQKASVIAIGIAVFSLGIYIWTSIRLSHALFQPLRELRDSIVKVGQRQFDLIVPLKGGEELAQIATTFNQMAGELRTYVAETDQQAIEASRVSRAILEALPYPIYIVDGDYAVKLMNPRAEALSQALEISGALPGAVRKAIDGAAALGTELVGDDLHRAVEIAVPGAAPGATPTYLPQVFRMAAVPGAKTGWAVLLVDVTKLRQFDLAKTKALSIIGHEVKTPVTSIRLTLHLLLEEKIGALTADQRELVEAGRDDCERLLTVLQALLELARFESGRVAMRAVPVAPAALLAQADAMHGDYVRRLGVTVITEPVPPGLPAVQADAIHVVRLLGNYLTNAAKYGQPKQTVAMRAELRADGFVRLNVRNRAVRPLTEAEQAKIFDPFYRREGERAEGTGLGLTICREIAAAHGGRVGVWASGDVVDFYVDLRVVSETPSHVTGPRPALHA
jgi:NtrC-family two-component system sensor histidine kinase KinB